MLQHQVAKLIDATINKMIKIMKEIGIIYCEGDNVMGYRSVMGYIDNVTPERLELLKNQLNSEFAYTVGDFKFDFNRCVYVAETNIDSAIIVECTNSIIK